MRLICNDPSYKQQALSSFISWCYQLSWVKTSVDRISKQRLIQILSEFDYLAVDKQSETAIVALKHDLADDFHIALCPVSGASAVTRPVIRHIMGWWFGDYKSRTVNIHKTNDDILRVVKFFKGRKVGQHDQYYEYKIYRKGNEIWLP